MDSSNEQLELEEGEINDLEDGEIEDDEATEFPVKTTSNVTPSSNVDSDFSRNSSTLREEKSPHFSPKIHQNTRRREDGASFRYNNNESWSKRPQYDRTPVHVPQFVKGPRPSLPWSRGRGGFFGMNRGRQRPLLPTPPRLPMPLMNTRSKPFIPQPCPRSPSPQETPQTDKEKDDFAFLLERHKQIQLQLENLEKEESEALLDNDDIIDDSFIDIPVDGDGQSNLDQGSSEEASFGVVSSEAKEEKTLPDKFSPFKIKPLRPPIPSLKELSEKQKQQEETKDVVQSLENVSINNDPTEAQSATSQKNSAVSVTNLKTTPSKRTLGAAKRKRRRIRRKKQREIKKNAAIKNIVPKPNYDSSKVMEPTSEIDSKLMQIASLSENTEMNMKMRNTSEQQQKRRERLKQWQQTQAGKVRRSPSVKSGSDGKEFEKDDYLEAPMDVESDTPDGPALPLIEESGNDPPPPPPLPPSSREQELMTLLQQQQQMAYGNYPIHALVNQTNVSPNIHGFYPPGQIMFSDWQGGYPVELSEAGLLSAAPSTMKPSAAPVKSTDTEEEDDDEADLLREILLKSVAKKRAAKSTDKKASDSYPSSPQQQPRTSKAQKPTAKNKDVDTSRRDIRPKQQQHQPIVPLQPPQHEPVVIQLGEDSDDSDDSDKEEQVLKPRGGFFGSLDMMIKQARQSAVENSKPKRQRVEPTTVPKTPDALAHLPEERRAEYRRLKEQLAMHEGRKRQPLSDISQDKETKSENEGGEDKMEVQEESSEVKELKQKVKSHEEKLAKTRNFLSEDQNRLTKMTSLLSDKTTLLEEQEAKVAKIKKQLEAHQKAMLNNRVFIKKLHEKAMIVKDRVAKRLTVSRNIEEELLRMKSMVSAVRKNPGFYKSNENKESNQASSAEATPETQPGDNKRMGPGDNKRVGPGDNKRVASLKRSVDDIDIVNAKKAKLDSPKSQSVKASPRKQALAEKIAQERARLKALEQELSEKLNNYSKSSVNKQGLKGSPVKSVTKTSTENTSNNNNDSGSSKSKESALEVDKVGPSKIVTVQSPAKTLDMDIDAKQLDYLKTLQIEKEKKGPVFPAPTIEIPQPAHKKVAKCIWLESKSMSSPVVDVETSNIDWLASSNNDIKDKEDDKGSSGSIPIGLYESVLLYFKSYRLSPYFRTKSGMSLKSLSHTNRINPALQLCKYELKGTCNAEDCQYQHKRDYTPSTDDTMKDLAAYIITDKQDTSITKETENKIQDIIQTFVKQYKSKIPMDDLYLLLVNHVRVQAGMLQPFYVNGAKHSQLLQPNKKVVMVDESISVDKGRGVQFMKKEEQKGLNDKTRECQEVRYFSEVYNSLTTLSNAVEESPSDVALWIKLARLQMCQKPDNEEETSDEGEQTDMGVIQSLNTLSRGLEANPKSKELWLEYLKLFYAQGNNEEHKELCEQAISFTPSYSIWWHYLNSADTYNDKRTICIRLINHLVSQDKSTALYSHRLVESLLYLVQLELYTGRFKTALATFMLAIGKKRPTTSSSQDEIPKLYGKLSPQDLSIVWLGYIHVFEFHRLPSLWFDQKYGQPSRMVAKDPFVFPWQPCGGTRASSEKLLALFHDALSLCTFKDKSMSKVSLCLPLYQNLLALERAHGRVDSAKGICRRLLQNNPTILELWQCLGALEESTGNPEQALAVLNEGLTKCSYDCELAYTIARLHLEQKQPSKAVDILISNTKTKYLKCTSSNYGDVDPIKLYRKLLNQPLPYDSQQLQLVDGCKPCGKDELYLWLSYCLLLELAPNISPLCLQYNLSADSAYETAVHSILNTKHAQTVWLEYLFYKKSKLLQSNPGQHVIKTLDDLISRCLVSASSSQSLPFSTSEYWQDYSFHNQVINLYLGCLPQSFWSAVFRKYLKAYPSNLQLTIRACEHEVKTGSLDHAVRIAAVFLAENPKCITMWKIIISLNLQRNHYKEALKLYHQATDMLPFAATLWKDFVMFEMVHSNKSSVSDIMQSCDKVGVDIQDYMNTLMGK